MLTSSPARRPPTARPRRRSGTTVVEFAVIAPLLFSLILGIVEFGRMFMVAQVAVNGSREGGRYGVQGDNFRTAKDATDYTKSYLAAAGVPNAAVTTCTLSYQNSGGTWVAMADADPVSGVSSGTPMKLYVEVDFGQVTWLPSGIFVSKNTLIPGTTIMRKE